MLHPTFAFGLTVGGRKLKNFEICLGRHDAADSEVKDGCAYRTIAGSIASQDFLAPQPSRPCPKPFSAGEVPFKLGRRCFFDIFWSPVRGLLSMYPGTNRSREGKCTNILELMQDLVLLSNSEHIFTLYPSYLRCPDFSNMLLNHSVGPLRLPLLHEPTASSLSVNAPSCRLQSAAARHRVGWRCRGCYFFFMSAGVISPENSGINDGASRPGPGPVRLSDGVGTTNRAQRGSGRHHGAGN